MEIAGDYIAVLLPGDSRLRDLPPPSSNLLLVDWKTGNMHVSRSLISSCYLLTV